MNLATRYLGLDLKSPLVASASPLSRTLDGMKRLEDSGAAAIVMFSLFEEQIVNESLAIDHFMQFGTDYYAEAVSFLPEPDSFQTTPEKYLELIREAKASLSIPVIASLNGISKGGWVRYAKEIEQAGADAIELNLYKVPADPGVLATEVERDYLSVVRSVKWEVGLPLAVKISPFFSSPANMARAFTLAGAQALVLFNRFYEPDFDLENLEVVPKLVLSDSDDLRLPLHWTAILHDRVNADLAITSGVHSYEDVLKAIMAGAKITMLASELLKNGTQRLGQIEAEMRTWLEEHEYESLAQARGSMSYLRVADPGAFVRANYVKELQSFRVDPASTVHE